MKKLSLILLAALFGVSASAQTVSLRFEGAANSNNNNAHNFLVDLDGRQYYSTNAEATNSAAKQVVLNDIGLGSHMVKIYDVTDNSVNSTPASDPIYSNSFQLRSGYDMVIAIRKNGQVSFSEKRINTNGTTVSNSSMTDANFDKVLKSVSSKWSQSSRYNAVKSAIANKSNYFSTDQVGQLLLQITSETKRLELAKLSYPRVTDPTNFSDVVDLFKVQSNKDNIQQFIQAKNPEIAGTTGTDYAHQPLTTQQFNQLQRKIKNQYQAAGKYAVLSDALNTTTNYFTTVQLKQLLPLITTESDRLTLAKQSYSHVSDPTNFSTLYTLFTTQANRDEFNNFIKYGESTSTTGQYANRVAMSDGDFSKLQLKARLHFSQSNTVSDIKSALSNTSNYFTLDQIRSLLTMVKSESDRLTLAKLAYQRVVDPTNFTQLYDLFTSQSSIDELNNYIKTNPS